MSTEEEVDPMDIERVALSLGIVAPEHVERVAAGMGLVEYQLLVTRGLLAEAGGTTVGVVVRMTERIARLESNLAAAQRELHRLAHGTEVEGDGLCPEGIRAEAARAWARLWHREARRLWREVQDLNALLSEEHREVMRLRSVIRRYLRTNPPQVEALRDLLVRSANGESIDAGLAADLADLRARAEQAEAEVARLRGELRQSESDYSQDTFALHESVREARAAALREAAHIAKAHGGISAYYAIAKLAAEVEP